MYTVKIMHDYLQSPILVYGTEGIATWYKLINEDPLLTELGNQAMEMYSSCYLLNHNGKPCYFDHQQERQNSKKMLEIIEKIIARLNEINDGSFVIEDYETNHLKSLLTDTWKDADDNFVKIYGHVIKSDLIFPTTCPTCNETSIHLYMHRHDNNHGGIWIWCSSCKSYIHMDGVLPEWWKNCEEINIEKVNSIPDYLDTMTKKIDPWVSNLRKSL